MGAGLSDVRQANQDCCSVVRAKREVVLTPYLFLYVAGFMNGAIACALFIAFRRTTEWTSLKEFARNMRGLRRASEHSQDKTFQPESQPLQPNEHTQQ